MHLFYPDLCIACNRQVNDIEETFCFDCYAELPFVRFNDLHDNEFAEHFRGKLELQYGCALFYFMKSGVVQEIIKQLKYHGKDNYGIKLGRLFGQTYKDSVFVQSVDTIIPVPLHKSRESKRTYNQSRKFAEGISQFLSIPVSVGNLVRNKNTLTQTKMNNETRIRNVKNAFSVLNKNEYINKHVLLVDDVLTTGSTLLECAVTLKDIPGIRISMSTIAMGETI
jgi:ComF family protein